MGKSRSDCPFSETCRRGPLAEKPVKGAVAGTGSSYSQLLLAAINHGYTGRTSFNEAIVFSSLGWNHLVAASKGEKESSDFKLCSSTPRSKTCCRLSVSKRRPTAPVEVPVMRFKGEMTLDAGLEIFRTMFGVDAYFRLVHGLGLPIRFFTRPGAVVSG